MDWLQSLLWDPSSVAHIVFLYAFVVAAGVYLGKIKIFGVSLGVTFVLFAGILMGHFGFTADTHILHFIREFGLILFVFCIGLQVGPSFFSSFKKGGMTLNLLAVGIVVLNIAVALGLYYLWNGRVELPMMVGILYGAVTNTPGLGAANEALNQLSYNGPQIALGYACAYPLGVVGIIGSIIAIRYIFRVNMTKEEESLKTQSGDAHHKPHMMSLEVRNESISGKTLIEIKEFLGRNFIEKEEIEALIAEHQVAPHLRLLQKRLAKEVTVMVHSEDDYNAAVDASNILFGNATSEALRKLDEDTLLAVFEGVPQFEISRDVLAEGVKAVDLFVDNAAVFASKGEMRKLVQGGGVSLNKEKLAAFDQVITTADLLDEKYLLVQRGKKNYYLLIAK